MVDWFKVRGLTADPVTPAEGCGGNCRRKEAAGDVR